MSNCELFLCQKKREGNGEENGKRFNPPDAGRTMPLNADIEVVRAVDPPAASFFFSNERAGSIT